jgi:hypothetical protein
LIQLVQMRWGSRKDGSRRLQGGIAGGQIQDAEKGGGKGGLQVGSNKKMAGGRQGGREAESATLESEVTALRCYFLSSEERDTELIVIPQSCRRERPGTEAESRKNTSMKPNCEPELKLSLSARSSRSRRY